jgi:hypothetical protein
VNEIHSPILRRLLADWEERRFGDALPARADFDVLDFKYCLGSIALLDVLYEPLRFRFRVHGTGIVRRVGYEMTGKEIGEMPSSALVAQMRAHFGRVIATRTPMVETRTRELLDDNIVECEVLVLPLASDGDTIDMLIAGVVFP